jgi:flagellar protein FliS
MSVSSPALSVAAARRRYLAEAIETASPAVRLIMLFDRLDLDLRSAAAAFVTGSIKDVNDRLIHAQEIIVTLRDSLQLDAWDGAPGLHALYNHLFGELVGANQDKDRDRVVAAERSLNQIGQAWRDAAARNQQKEPTIGLG